MLCYFELLGSRDQAASFGKQTVQSTMKDQAGGGGR